MRMHGDGSAGGLLERDFGGFLGSILLAFMLHDRLAGFQVGAYLLDRLLRRQTSACIFGCRRLDSGREREYRTATRRHHRRTQSRCLGVVQTFQSAKIVRMHVT